jgi:hypothetical protein
MGPDALRLNGALFRCSRNFWDVADAMSAEECLAFAFPAPSMFVSDVQDAFPLWHVERLQRLTLVAPGSSLLVRRSHGYPDFLPPLGTERRLRRLYLAC